MKKLLALTALTVSLAAAAPASAITYTFNQTIGSGFASGSITTDNTLGALGSANITGFNITINDGSGTFVLTNANGQVGIVGSALTATATGLFYNYSATGTNYALFQNPTLGSGIDYFCLQTAGCYVPTSTPGQGVRVQGTIQFNSLQGNLQFARANGAVPEPATWGLMLLGFGAVGYSLRRRKARIAYA